MIDPAIDAGASAADVEQSAALNIELNTNRAPALMHLKLNYQPNPDGDHKKLDKYINSNVKLPESFSLASRYNIKILDQAQLGSCVVNCLAGVINSLYDVNPSRLYYYFNGRVATGMSPVEDTGIDIVGTYPYFKSFGYVNEESWQYDIENYKIIPPISTYKESKVLDFTFKAVPQDDASIKSAIYSVGFVMFAAVLYKSFMTHEVMKTGIVPMPERTESIDGGHCLNLIGWTTIKDIPYYIMRNSWGLSWGNDGAPTPTEGFFNNGANGGYAYIPVAYILDPTLTSELVVVQRKEPVENTLTANYTLHELPVQNPVEDKKDKKYKKDKKDKKDKKRK